MLVFNSSYHIS